MEKVYGWVGRSPDVEIWYCCYKEITRVRGFFNLSTERRPKNVEMEHV